MEPTSREKDVERIRKLLAHCLGNGTTTEEANTARLMACKLMATHRVSFDEVTRTCQRQGEENKTGTAPEEPRPQGCDASASEQRSDRGAGDKSSPHFRDSSDPSSPHAPTSEGTGEAKPAEPTPRPAEADKFSKAELWLFFFAVILIRILTL